MTRALLVTLLCATACSAVDRQYLWSGYDLTGSAAIKRIVVAGWAPPEHAAAAQLAAHIGADLVKLRRNYLVYEAVPLTRSYAEVCGARDGVLTFTAHELTPAGETVTVAVEATLHDCKSGRLVWRAEGSTKVASNDADLQNLASTYAQHVGEVAKPFAAPLFALIQDLIASLPDPTLTDDEVLEKIELGQARHQGPPLSTLPRQRASIVLDALL